MLAPEHDLEVVETGLAVGVGPPELHVGHQHLCARRPVGVALTLTMHQPHANPVDPDRRVGDGHASGNLELHL